jgi:hypothetical protein
VSRGRQGHHDGQEMHRSLAVVVPGVIRTPLHYAVPLVQVNLASSRCKPEDPVKNEDVIHRIRLVESLGIDADPDIAPGLIGAGKPPTYVRLRGDAEATPVRPAAWAVPTQCHSNSGLDSGEIRSGRGIALEPATLQFILICDLVS